MVVERRQSPLGLANFPYQNNTRYVQLESLSWNNNISQRGTKSHLKKHSPTQRANSHLKWHYLSPSKTFRELLPNKSKHFFRVHIKHYWYFEGVTSKQYYTLFQTLSNIDIFRELLSNNTTHFSKAYIKQYWHFQSYRQTILHTFPELTSNNTDIFRELLANNTTQFSRVYTKQYWHFERVSSKLKKSEFVLHNTDTFRELLPNDIDLFRTHIKQHSHFHRVITK